MITFRDFMESALYDPKSGFYETREPKNDFYTAPELHPAFGGILAAEIVARLERLAAQGVPAPYFIVEMGSGNGTLARAILRSIKESRPEWLDRATYVLVERSESRLIASVLKLRAEGYMVMGHSKLAEMAPGPGVFLSNELVDAFPAHLLEKRDGRVQEVYVTDGKEKLGELSRIELAGYAHRISEHLPEGGRHAVNLEARKWLRDVSSRLTAGAVITIDYGRRYGPQVPNPPRAFFRHHVSDNLVERPGEQDLTVNVDFDELIEEGEMAGLRLASYDTMSRFLIDRGIIDRLAQAAGDDLASYKERNKIKQLLHPDGMGEVFKVLIQEKMPR